MDNRFESLEEHIERTTRIPPAEPTVDIHFGTLEEFRAGKPGIYRNIREREYHSFEAASKSRLTTCYRTNPARMQWEYRNRDKPKSDATKLGNAAHAYVLEPDQFDLNYAVFEGALRTNAKKAEYAALCEEYGENYVIREKQYEQCIEIREAVRGNAGVRALLDAPGERELTILWIDERTGLLCKCRIDIYPYDEQIIVDLKTARDSDETGFSKAIANYEYDCQSGMYMSAAKAVNLPARAMLFIPVEKSDPYDCYLWMLESAAVSDGWKELQPMFDLYKECLEANHWPGPAESIQMIDVPGWRTRNILFPYNDREQYR